MSLYRSFVHSGSFFTSPFRSLRTFLVFGLVFCGWCFGSHHAWGAIKLGEKNPTVGKPTSVTITNAKNAPVMGVELVVTYHPFSNTEKTHVAKTRSDSGGVLLWTPETAGLVVLKARVRNGTDPQGKPRYQVVASTTIGVKYQRLPIAGLLVFLLAGTFLFGGMAYGLLKAFSQDL